MMNADRLRATCLNCIYFDCIEDENGKCIEPYCEKGHEGIDDKTPACRTIRLGYRLRKWRRHKWAKNKLLLCG